jgi:hypothetical protein
LQSREETGAAAEQGDAGVASGERCETEAVSSVVVGDVDIVLFSFLYPDERQPPTRQRRPPA